MCDMTFGQYVASIRKGKGLSQRSLARLADVTNSTVNRLEAGSVNPDPSTLIKVSEALGVDAAILFSKCGYVHVSDEFVKLAKKMEPLPDACKEELYKSFNGLVDAVMDKYDGDLI